LRVDRGARDLFPRAAFDASPQKALEHPPWMHVTRGPVCRTSATRPTSWTGAQGVRP